MSDRELEAIRYILENDEDVPQEMMMQLERKLSKRKSILPLPIVEEEKTPTFEDFMEGFK